MEVLDYVDARESIIVMSNMITRKMQPTCVSMLSRKLVD